MKLAKKYLKNALNNYLKGSHIEKYAGIFPVQTSRLTDKLSNKYN